MKLIFEYEEQTTGHLPDEDIQIDLPKEIIRKELPLPNVSEVSVVRHYINLSKRNFAVDVGFYPLGSCTMKYNPKINEDLARLEGLRDLHPLSPDDCVQGALQLMWELEQDLM